MAKRRNTSSSRPPAGRPAKASRRSAAGELRSGDRPAAGFALRFLGLLALLLMAQDLARPLLEPLVAGPTARLLAACLSWLGRSVTLGGADGLMIYAGAFRAHVVLECTFLMTASLYFSFVVAQGGSLRAKAMGLAAGLPALAAINQLRLVALVWAAARWPAWGHWLHSYPAQLLSILTASGACAAWLWACRCGHGGLAAFGLRALLWALAGLGPMLWLEPWRARFLEGLAGPAASRSGAGGVSLLVFLALTLASPAPWPRRLGALAAGLAVLLAVEAAGRMLAEGLSPFLSVLLLALQQLALPVALWLVAVRPHFSPPAS